MASGTIWGNQIWNSAGSLYWQVYATYNGGSATLYGYIGAASGLSGSMWVRFGSAQINGTYFSQQEGTYSSGTTITLGSTSIPTSSAVGFSATCSGGGWGQDGTSSGTIPKQLSTYTISYNANGGTGAPGNQTKTQTVNLTLSSTVPTKADDTSSGFTVTFDAGSGTATYDTYTATDENYYMFDHWNTKQDNTGTDYSPGGTYSTDAAATMYAQWQKTTVRGTIRLPSATRTGYTFLGWTRTPGSGVYVEDYYTAFGDEILYAEWSELTKLVNARVNGGWSGNVVKVQVNGNWVPVIDIKTSW